MEQIIPLICENFLSRPFAAHDLGGGAVLGPAKIIGGAAHADDRLGDQAGGGHGHTHGAGGKHAKDGDAGGEPAHDDQRQEGGADHWRRAGKPDGFL